MRICHSDRGPRMVASMAKNILIFSDATGQAGGVTFDEDRTNIYKLFRATRCGPDSPIDPAKQVAFYDPGLGSPRDNRFAFGWVGRKIYNVLSRATGFGITANIVDCYAALFGFGAQATESSSSALAAAPIPSAAWQASSLVAAFPPNCRMANR